MGPSGRAERAVIRTSGSDLAPEMLGPTSMHEHVLVDASVWYTNRTPVDVRWKDAAVSIESLPDVRWNALSFLDNLHLNDADVAQEELGCLKAAGGSAIVDMTNIGLGGDPRAVAAIAHSIGVSLIVGCGFYVHGSHPGWVCTASVDALEAAIDQQVQRGIDDSGILPGVIGEIGMSAPPVACERRVLEAAARVAHRYEMSLHIHVDNAGEYAMQHIEDCSSGGLDADRVVCGHMDERLSDVYHQSILATGASIAFDTFGSELYFSGVFSHPKDQDRLKHLADLIEAGFVAQIVLGHDVFVKAHWHRYGGNGYDHLLRRALPALETEFGVGPEAVHQLMVVNPRRLLACRPPIAAALQSA